MHTVNISNLKDFVSHVAVRNREPVMLWGQPGCGKSEGIAQAAEHHGAVLCDIRLSQYDSVDLRGMPDLAGDLTVWKLPSTMPFKGNPQFNTVDGLIFLFLDEINSATPAVSAVAYQLINDRRIGEHELLDNVVIIAAGNREGDRGVVNRMPTPLANRFTHIEVAPEVDDFCYHAQTRGAPGVGIAFIQFRKPLLSTFDPSKPDKAFATPRSWMKAFKYYNDASMPEHVKMSGIAGAVGDGPAAEFWGFVDVWGKMPDLKKILKDPEGTEVPTDAAMRYAVSVAISGEMAKDTADQYAKYLDRMAPEFSIMAWQMAVRRAPVEMTGTKAFIAMSRKFASVFQAGN